MRKRSIFYNALLLTGVNLLLRGENSKLSWTQVETGSAITWKYPSCVLMGDNSQAEFYSVAVMVILPSPLMSPALA